MKTVKIVSFLVLALSLFISEVADAQRVVVRLGAPRPRSVVYVAPRPVHIVPRPVYVAPRRVYAAPRRIYAAPRRVYVVPRRAYVVR